MSPASGICSGSPTPRPSTTFVDALVASDALAGIRLLDGLEERGRDLRGFLDQVIEVIRAGIVGIDSPGAHPVMALAGVARRLATIDPSRAGVGGLRLQLELALFPDVPIATAPPRPVVAATPRPATAPAPGPVAEAEPKPAEPKPVAPRPDTPPTPPVDAPVKAATKRVEATAEKADQSASPASEAPPADDPPAEAAEPNKPAKQPTPAAAGADAPAVAAPQATGDLAVLRDRWPEIVARISAHPPTKPLIVVCRPISVEDGVVTLGFPEDKAFLRDVAERRRSVLEENISTVLGRSVAVRCVATNIDVVPDLPSDEEAAWILGEARRIFGEEGADPAEVG